jgi:hypothetical protein
MSAEQLLGDHDALDLIRSLVDLGGLDLPSVWCRNVPHSVAELRPQFIACCSMLPGVAQY